MLTARTAAVGALKRQGARSVIPATCHALRRTLAASAQPLPADSDMSDKDKGKAGGYNFASSGYASCFANLPTPDTAALRASALKYLDEFDVQKWYDDPVTTILKGEKLVSPPSNLWITKDALAKSNGHQYLATPEQVGQLEEHIKTYRSPYKDIRDPLRRIEHKLLTEHAGFLIGNQCVDFQKQDGVTEMEESIMANQVERSLNDLLLEDELAGKLDINRKPVYVSCVSNFTNFLDLFRKTIRNMELGIPCVVLGRSNTVQHSYRWTELLADLLKEEKIDAGMLTYLSCTLEDIVRITTGCRDFTGMLYTTSSRDLARTIKSGYPNTVASTGGPNTLVATEWTPEVSDALRMSATIECAGQCTALRHAVVPDALTADEAESAFDGTNSVPNAPDGLRGGMFDGIFEGHPGNKVPPVEGDGAYTKHGSKDVYYKVGTEMPPDDIDEYWRKAVVDITRRAPASADDEEKVNDLARWLVRNQPISLAVNAPRAASFPLGRALFERTGLVVYTVGSTDEADAPPAMTCQARPQEAEVFGEFPPRRSLGVYTKYPVVVPSSTPSYDSSYRPEYLSGLTSSDVAGGPGLDYARETVDAVSDPSARGYCVELVNYLVDATASNPKRGFGTSRTAIWGLERPPLLDDAKTVIRCGAGVSYDDAMPTFLPFYVTNARGQAELSVDPANGTLLSKLKGLGIEANVEDDAAYEGRVKKSGEAGNIYNAVTVEAGGMAEYPMVGQFVSLCFPLGHIKSTMSGDEEFVEYFMKSEKWLKLRTE